MSDEEDVTQTAGFKVVPDDYEGSSEDKELEPLYKLEDAVTISENLSPRHRRIAQLLAVGKTRKEIAREIGCTPQSVIILAKNKKIQEEILRIQNRLYEDTVEERIKALKEDALSVYEQVLRDTRNRFRSGEKLQAANWILEQLVGKATQKHEVQGSILVGVLDKLDALEKSGKTVDQLPEPEMRDVTPQEKPEESQVEAERRKWDAEFD